MNLPHRIAAIASLAAAAVAIATLAVPFAHSQINPQVTPERVNVTPTLQPIGVAASGTTSTVWFHEPLSRQAVACQTVGGGAGGLTGIHCVSGRLP